MIVDGLIMSIPEGSMLSKLWQFMLSEGTDTAWLHGFE